MAVLAMAALQSSRETHDMYKIMSKIVAIRHNTASYYMQLFAALKPIVRYYNNTLHS